jgi:EAL domain-containing protein (putative c-di-GMP-specific phosphodiesterase class I)
MVVESTRLLVVDDDRQVLSALCTVLRNAGFNVIGAESGESAIGYAREFTFDVAVCDRQLPGLDGIDLLQQLREIQPMCQRVLLTGGLDLNTTINAVNRGAVTSVLEKPVRGEALVGVVSEAIEGRRKMVEAYQSLQQQTLGVERGVVKDVLASDHLQLAVQPIVRAAGGGVFGHEALLRSSHSRLDGPLEVLAAVERHQLIDELADVVVDRARTWLDTNPGDHSLFLNLHPNELADPEALGNRLQRLSRHSGRVILEITERSSIYGVAAWEQSLEVIRGLGLDIAVDDLGAGYSALSILAELKPRFIKLDMSIVRDADRLSHKQRLIDLLCRFADATDALLVAEGIETEAEATTVRECGAHLLQGYLIGRPRLPAALRVVASEVDDQRDAG